MGRGGGRVFTRCLLLRSWQATWGRQFLPTLQCLGIPRGGEVLPLRTRGELRRNPSLKLLPRGLAGTGRGAGACPALTLCTHWCLPGSDGEHTHTAEMGNLFQPQDTTLTALDSGDAVLPLPRFGLPSPRQLTAKRTTSLDVDWGERRKNKTKQKSSDMV